MGSDPIIRACPSATWSSLSRRYKHLFEQTGIVPAESVLIGDLLENVVAARECSLHAIQFSDPESCRAGPLSYLPDAGL